MKKTFLARRNALLSSTKFSWGALALAGVLLILLVRLFAPNFFWKLFAPAFGVTDALSTHTDAFFSGFGNAVSLAAQNADLKSENAALANENQSLLANAKDIRGLASASSTSAASIVAGVVARPPTSPYDTLVLAAGSRGGVMVGQEAFGNGGVPVGVVSAVLPDFSRVSLFSAPAMMVDGWVGSARLPLTIVGSGAGTMRANLSRSANVAVGDSVYISGPGMLPVGTVTGVDSDQSSPSVTIHIQPTLNFFSVTWVELRSTGAAFTGSLSWATSTQL